MYLSDRELHSIISDLAIVPEPGGSAFDPAEQIQPSSIDLRLSAVFWIPRRRVTIDLRRSRLLEIQPRRYYRRVTLAFGETIILKPFDLLLARTLERFVMPNGYSGELMSRSSFARLGLIVSLNGGYINPGWQGYQPMQLLNFGPNPIRLMAGLSICTLRIARLSSQAIRPYGATELQSIYLNDDGGPSYWWRDKKVKQLHAILAERLVEEGIQRSIYRAIGNQEPEVIERLERSLARMKVSDLQNAESIVDEFTRREDRRRLLRRTILSVGRASFTVGLTLSLWAANKVPVEWWHYVIWGSSACLIALSVYSFRTEVGDHFGETELRASRKASD
jgi:deoxycytidine triphosphate deaminase